MRPDESGADFASAIEIRLPYSGVFQSDLMSGVFDDDAFVLTVTGPLMTLSLLPDYLLVNLGDGQPLLVPEAIVGSFEVFETFTIDDDFELHFRSVADGQLKDDTILQAQYPASVAAGMPMFFYTATFATPGARDEEMFGQTYHYSGVYFVVVGGANFFDESQPPELRALVGDQFSAGRYLITQDNPTGQRAAAWGSGWIQYVDSNTAYEAETNPTLLDEVASQTEVTQGGTAQINVSGLIYDEPTDTWFGEDTQGVLQPIEGLANDVRDLARDTGRLVGSVFLDTSLIAIQAYADSSTLVTLAAAADQLNTATGVGQAFHSGFTDMTSEIQRAVDNPDQAGDVDVRVIERSQQMVRDAIDAVGGPVFDVLRFFTDRMSIETSHSVLSVSATFSAAGGQQRQFAPGHGDMFIGTAFDDVARMGDLNDAAFGALGHDFLSGEAGSDILIGGDGNDTVDGGLGADKMYGGAGNDVFYVNDANDFVMEHAGEGKDTVRTSVTFSIKNNNDIENLTIIGSGARNGYGNSRWNTVTGNDAANKLGGLNGNDVLVGGGGNDTLDGGVGADAMSGGAGNDVYYVNDRGDSVSESGGSGADVVRSSISWSLGEGLENLTIIGSGARNGSGNDLNNTLTGNGANNALYGVEGNDTINAAAGDDTLNGGTGIDFLRGEAGDDTYDVDLADDFVRELEGGGVDTVRTSVTRALDPNVENLIITGSASRNGSGNSQDNLIVGNTGANILDGRLGNDTIIAGAGTDKVEGGEGIDVLTGGAGLDAFVFDVAASAANLDAITDFNVADDIIHLDNAIFTQLGAAGAVSAGMLRIGSSAADSNDFLIYNFATGALYYDANANAAGGVVRIATLGAGLALTAADFLVI